MFFQRLITTIILVPLVLLTLFYGPGWFLIGVLLLILLISIQESFQLIPLNLLATKISYLAVMLLALWGCAYFFDYWLSLGLILWIAIAIAIISYPRSQQYWGYPSVVGLVCLILLPLFCQSLIHIYNLPQGKGLFVYLLFLIWASDIGAYLTGKALGSHKLIPQVSPGKSWEGLIGGLTLALLIALAGFLYFKPAYPVLWFVLALVTVIISVFGDLFISILKRRCHLKDTGNVIPGHGGMLDRLDSLIAAAPVFYFGLINIPLRVI